MDDDARDDKTSGEPYDRAHTEIASFVIGSRRFM